MIKVLHTADIHLDVPFKIANVAKAQTRRSELRGALSSLFTYARLEHFDLMLIAGDMFDREFVTPDTVALVLLGLQDNYRSRKSRPVHPRQRLGKDGISEQRLYLPFLGA